MQPTAEQQQCLSLFDAGSTLRIEAAAGSGKTTTLRYLMTDGQRRGKTLYTSFGKKTVEEAKARFPSSVDVRTNHSLAFRSTGSRWQRQGRLEGRITTRMLADLWGWSDSAFAPFAKMSVGAYAVLRTIDRYCQSADAVLDRQHVPELNGNHTGNDLGFATRVLDFAQATWDRMLDPDDRMPITHDVYLKIWALGKPQLGYRTILLDEAQDTTDLMIGLLAAQRGTQLVVVGDRYQQIYSWRGAVNAMSSFHTEAVGHLTQSFRFGPAIADVANAVLAEYLDAGMRVTGSSAIASHCGSVESPRAVLARTNAELIGALICAQLAFPGERFAVVGGTAEMEALVRGAMDLMQGMRTWVPDLAAFTNWSEVMEAAGEDGGAYLKPLVTMVQTYGPSMLLQHLQRAKGNERDESSCRQLFSTVHKAKGREFDTVKLCNDFAEKIPPAVAGGPSSWEEEEGNLLYVAVTRARAVLDVIDCAAATDAMRKYAETLACSGDSPAILAAPRPAAVAGGDLFA